MKVLVEYYKKCKDILQGILILSWLVLSVFFLKINELISDYINQCASNEKGILAQGDLLLIELILDVALDFIAPTAIVLTIYKLVLKYIDEEGWKKKYPELDISGTWRDTTYYVQYLDGNGLSNITPPYSEVSPAIIRQTCHEVKIEKSIGDDFEWHSLLCGWNDDRLDILYAVDYYSQLQRQGYPEKRYGYESMIIDKKEQQPKQRPNKMVGKFWQCCSADGRPVYMGEVTYERDNV